MCSVFATLACASICNVFSGLANPMDISSIVALTTSTSTSTLFFTAPRLCHRLCPRLILVHPLLSTSLRLPLHVQLHWRHKQLRTSSTMATSSTAYMNMAISLTRGYLDIGTMGYTHMCYSSDSTLVTTFALSWCYKCGDVSSSNSASGFSNLTVCGGVLLLWLRLC